MTRPHAIRRPKVPTREAPSPRDFRAGIWICLALAAAVFIVFGQTYGHDFLNYDDPEYRGNVHVRGGLSLSAIAWAFRAGYSSNSFPLTWISHMFDFQVFGSRSGPPHLVNAALHAASAILLFLILERVTGATGRSAFVAFAFALHPLRVESVAWLAERKDVLCTLFWMLTFYAYTSYVARPSVGRCTTVLALFVCGLLAKPMIVTLPFAALLLDIWPLRRFENQPARKLVLEKIPLIVLALGACVIAYVAQQRQGVVNAVDRIPLGIRAGNAFFSYVAYLRDFVWPANLAVFYPYVERPVWQMIFAALAIVAVTVYAIRMIRQRPWIAAGWFWYLGTLIPVIGLIQVGSQSRADRYTYIPLIGISIIVAWGASELFESRHWNWRVLAAVATGVCVAWAIVTWIDVQYWRNSVTLFTHALAVTDENYVAYNNLGVAMREEGNVQDAESDFQHVVAIRPDDAEAQDNLGEALTGEARIGEAVLHLRESVRLLPEFAKAHVDLGTALLRVGNADDAESELRLAAQLRPEDAAAQYSLGGVLMSEGQEQEAMTHLQEALPLLIAEVETNPESVDGHYNLGTLYGMLGRADEAIAEFYQAIHLRPTDAQARFNLGTALIARNRVNEASDQFAEAIRLVPEYEAAHLSLGRALVAMGRRDDAIREYQETLRLDPGSAEARRSIEALGSPAR